MFLLLFAFVNFSFFRFVFVFVFVHWYLRFANFSSVLFRLDSAFSLSFSCFIHTWLCFLFLFCPSFGYCWLVLFRLVHFCSLAFASVHFFGSQSFALMYFCSLFFIIFHLCSVSFTVINCSLIDNVCVLLDKHDNYYHCSLHSLSSLFTEIKYTNRLPCLHLHKNDYLNLNNLDRFK